MFFCFAGESPPASDDVQCGLREAAGVWAAVRTVAPPPPSPEEPLHHRPPLPLPVHQEEDPSITELSHQDAAGTKTSALYSFSEQMNWHLEWKHGSGSMSESTFGASNSVFELVAPACRPLWLCASSVFVPPGSLVRLVPTMSAPCQMLSHWEHTERHSSCCKTMFVLL